MATTMKSLVLICAYLSIVSNVRASNAPTNSTKFIIGEKIKNVNPTKKTTTSNIIWRDNSETRKLGYDKRNVTITRVVHHGIYPALNMTVPVVQGNGNVGKSSFRRLKRYTAYKIGVNEAENPIRSVERYESFGHEYNHTKNDDIKFYQSMRNFNYTRAEHYPKRNSTDSSQANTIGRPASKYRTLYFPATSISRNYVGDAQNKGHVKLVSVAYYNINGSNDDVRSYQKDLPRRRNPYRRKRDLAQTWKWLGDLFRTGAVNIPKQETNQPNSLPFTAENPVDEALPIHYGYSTIGHSHRSVGYGQNQLEKPTEEVALLDYDNLQTEDHSELTETTVSPSVTSDQPSMPRSDPVLIQAPQRRRYCQPPKKIARGRCRTVWASGDAVSQEK